MTKPIRLQLSRRKGFNLQALSLEMNGLPAVRVSRPGPWGNPFPWRGDWIVWASVARGFRADEVGRRHAAVAYHRDWLTGSRTRGPNKDSGDLIVYESGLALSTSKAAEAMATGLAMLNSASVKVPKPPLIDAIRLNLAGQNLACWCKPGEPCHADVLMEIANR